MLASPSRQRLAADSGNSRNLAALSLWESGARAVKETAIDLEEAHITHARPYAICRIALASFA